MSDTNPKPSSSGLKNIEPRDLCEQYVLAGMLLLPDKAIPAVHALLEPDDFFDPLNKAVFETLLKMYSNNVAIEAESAAVYGSMIARNSKVPSRDVYLYLARIITERGAFAAHVPWYAKQIREYVQRERLHKAGIVLQDGEKTTEELIEETSSTLADVARRNEIHRPKLGSDAAAEFYDTMNEQVPDATLATGFPSIDKYVQLRPERLTIVAARPRVGKSTLLLNVAANSCLDYGNSVMFVSLEMSLNDLTKRIMSSRTGVPFHMIERQRRELHAKWWDAMMRCGDELSNSRIYLCDQTSMSVADIAMVAKERKANEGLDALFVDYLTLVDPEKGTSRAGREAQVAGISRGLKKLARELHIPVVAAAQLNREYEKRAPSAKKKEEEYKGLPPTPKLSDLRESGAIEQDADIVLFINRRPDDTKGEAVISVAKNRHGTGGKVSLRWNGGNQRFEEFEIDDPQGTVF